MDILPAVNSVVILREGWGYTEDYSQAFHRAVICQTAKVRAIAGSFYYLTLKDGLQVHCKLDSIAEVL